MTGTALSRTLAAIYRNVIFPLIAVFFLPVWLLGSALKQHAPAGHRLRDAFFQIEGMVVLGLFGLFAVWLASRLFQTARFRQTAHQSPDTADLAYMLSDLIPSSPPAKPLEGLIRALGRPLPAFWVKYLWIPLMIFGLCVIVSLYAPTGWLSSVVGPRYAASEGRLQFLLWAVPLLTIVNLRVWALREHQRLQPRGRNSRSQAL